MKLRLDGMQEAGQRCCHESKKGIDGKSSGPHISFHEPSRRTLLCCSSGGPDMSYFSVADLLRQEIRSFTDPMIAAIAAAPMLTGSQGIPEG